MKRRSALALLRDEPRRFRFDAAIRVLTRARRTQDPADAVRFRSPAGLVYPAADVLDVRQPADAPPEVAVGLMGLVGPSGVLPRYYSEVISQTLRSRSTALRDFVDMLAHRFVAFFARGGTKYRPARAAEAAALPDVSTADPVARVLLALSGYGTPGLVERLAAGPEALLHYAGLFALRPRSAERLGAMVADWLGMQVEVVEFAGAWLSLPPDQRTRLAANGAWCRLGVDAAAGVRAWDPQARFVLRIGPLDLKTFQRLLPDRLALHRLVSLVRAYVGFEQGFAINPVLAARQIPPLLLDATADPPPRLGWNTWVPSPGGFTLRIDAADAVFEAEVIEAQQVHAGGSTGMSGWGSGYVTDIAYMTGYYRHQSPSLMALACLLGGAASPLPAPDDPVSYLELGCGQGLGALILAASNPRWTVTAIDFNPAHVAAARAWAAQAGLANIRFLEADLATLAEDAVAAAVPSADFVSLHGVWSWVPRAVQSGIVRLLRAKVTPGGAVHVSYNALPAWGSALGMQRLVRDSGRRLAMRSDRQAEEGLKLARDLQAAEALQLKRSPLAMSLLERTGGMPASYLAHEYMNDSFAPCFHADVAGALADAKLEWIASANLIENFPELTMSPEQRAVTQRLDDPLLRELVKDTCLERSLRHDVFVRGARRITPAARDAALMDLHLALNIRPEDMPYEANVPAGQAALNRSFYGPITQALAKAPRRVGELLAIPDLDGRRDNPAELVGMLVGLELAEPALRAGAEPTPQALRCNRAMLASLGRTESFGRPLAAASHALGAGAPCTLFDLYVIDRLQAGEDGAQMDAWISDLGSNLDENGQGRLRETFVRALRTRLPILRAQGVF